MRFKVFLLRHRGRRLSWREVHNGPSFVGHLLAFAPIAFRLRGFERLERASGAFAVVQEWHCELP
jgi:hypothetical protein